MEEFCLLSSRCMFSSRNVEIALRDGIKQQLQKEESGKDLNLEDLTEGFLAWSYLFHSSFDQAIYLLTYLFIYFGSFFLCSSC